MIRRIIHRKILLKTSNNQRFDRGLETYAIYEHEQNQIQEKLHVPVMLDEIMHHLVDSTDNYEVCV